MQVCFVIKVFSKEYDGNRIESGDDVNQNETPNGCVTNEAYG